MTILAMESSCDETSVAIYDFNCEKMLAHQIYSQIETHQPYGGVVPELASREHIKKMLPLVDSCLKEAKITSKDISHIAYTKGPGLIGALLIASSCAHGLAAAWQKPVIGVHHMEGHLLSVMLEKDKPSFPFVCLLISGGHTLLVHAKSIGNYEILGETLDDAVGEAFDKTAALLGYPYPGGAKLSALAQQGEPCLPLTRPMIKQPNLDFSFSGLKTQVSLLTKSLLAENDTLQTRANIAASFEHTVAQTLLIKCKRALKQTHCKSLVIAGGVAANREIQKTLKDYAHKNRLKVYVPSMEYCGDNAAMIAYAASCHLNNTHDTIAVKPRWSLEDLNA